MSIRDLIEKARAAQHHPLQLMLFPPRFAPWEDEKNTETDSLEEETQDE